MSYSFQSKIQIFLDGADEATMLEASKNPLIKGFTTNPSLMKKAGVTDYESYCKKMLEQLPKLPISFEVFSDEIEEMREQATKIKTWGENVYVKIPVMNTRSQSTASLVEELNADGVKLNVTAIFSIEQVQEVCEALKSPTPSIVSVFAGRIADSGVDPMPLMEASAECCKKAGETVELLWASTRETYNIVQAEKAGCHIITSPKSLIDKMNMFGKAPTEMSLDTVKAFKADAESAGFAI